MEERGQQEEGGALVEAVAVLVDEGAAAAGEGVLFEDGDVEAGFGEVRCRRDAADAGACGESMSVWGGVWEVGSTHQ